MRWEVSPRSSCECKLKEMKEQSEAHLEVSSSYILGSQERPMNRLPGGRANGST